MSDSLILGKVLQFIYNTKFSFKINIGYHISHFQNQMHIKMYTYYIIYTPFCNYKQTNVMLMQVEKNIKINCIVGIYTKKRNKLKNKFAKRKPHAFCKTKENIRDIKIEMKRQKVVR